MNQRKTIAAPPRCWLPMLAMFAGLMVGCNNMPGQPEVIEVKARYLDLDNRSVAVVVSTSDYIDFNFPDARESITAEISRRIQTNVPGVQVTNPADVIQWQDDNEYWATRPPSAIIEQLKVDRLVLVEIGEYRTHEPGDKYILRGVISATVNVVEAEAPDPDTFGGSYSKSVMYPRSKDSWIGKAAISEKKIEAQTQYRFCEETAGLFYDHELVR
ncbi:MAG: hypothetical protein ACE37H_15085 [Phycisphaeraceae bacterium]